MAENINNRPTAAIIIIGNEILSGRTQDVNVQYIAQKLAEQGIDLKEVRIIPDDEQIIIDYVNKLRSQATYVFTTGGIGPTHDDITSASIAKAFSLPLTQHPEAYARLKSHYEARNIPLNEASLRMTMTPEGADLIDNNVSIAPGFIVENVYVMAGIPKIMAAMLDSVINSLDGAEPIKSRSINANLIEGNIAKELADLQKEYPQIEIGSYPYKENETFCVSIVLRGTDNLLLDDLEEKIKDMVISKTG